MGETFRGSATQLTEQRTDQMIMVFSIALVLALAVGGFVVAANSHGNQDQSPLDDPQEIVLDRSVPAETAQLQFLRLPDFVMESESGCLGPLCTEQGKIDIIYENLPDILPLCIDNQFLQGWYVDILVVGGYKPWEFGSYLDVWQKGDNKGRIEIQWTYMGHDPECCAMDYWQATFFVEQDICLESNQYPNVDPFTLTVPDGQRFIPGKCVTFDFYTFWTGCVPGETPSQDFTIIHSHSLSAFSKWFILTLQTHIFTVHSHVAHRYCVISE